MILAQIRDRKVRTNTKKAIDRFLHWHPSLISNRIQASAEEANEIDRYDLAEEFLKFEDSKVEDLNEYIEKHNLNIELLLEDLAACVDLAIPKAVYNTRLYLHCRANELDFTKERVSQAYPGIEAMPGFEFRFTKNYQREKAILYWIKRKEERYEQDNQNRAD